MGESPRSGFQHSWGLGPHVVLPRRTACLHRIPFFYHRVRRHSTDQLLTLAHNGTPIHRMKALLFVLLRAYEFKLAVPPEDIGKEIEIVQRPIVRGAESQGSQMPLLIKRVSR